MDYNKIVEEYDAITFGGYYDYVKEAKEIMPFIKPEGRVLEIGAGTGSLLVELHKNGFDVEGLDIADKMLAEMKKKLPFAKTYVRDCRTFSKAKTYDAILSFGGPLFFERMGNSVVLDDLMNEGIEDCIARIQENLVDGGVLILAIQPEHKNIRFNYRDNVDHQQEVYDLGNGQIRKHYQTIVNYKKVFDESAIITRHSNYEKLFGAKSIEFYENIAVIKW